ncbi:MAG: cytidine deaminase [Thaumarchaeota archaeon]|nr:MAG: cytidine deaminase [Nitrososphaerota archaeon]
MKRSSPEKELIRRAREARSNAYSPYSGVKIGAAVLARDGSLYAGCNIENSSYGLSNCAERTAIFKAISEGRRELVSISIVGDSEEFTRPCGACRQVMVQFNPRLRIIRVGLVDGYRSETTAEKLLPEAFNPSSLTRKS